MTVYDMRDVAEVNKKISSQNRECALPKRGIRTEKEPPIKGKSFGTSVAEPEPVELKLFGTWSRSRN